MFTIAASIIVAVVLLVLAIFLLFLFLVVGARREVEKYEREQYNALVRLCNAQYDAQMQNKHLWKD